MDKNNMLLDYTCDLVVVKPFNLIITAEEFEVLETKLIDKDKKDISEWELKQISKTLGLSYSKRRSSKTQSFMLFKNLTCKHCSKALLCEKTQKKLNLEDITIAQEFCYSKKHRKIMDLLNQQNKEIYIWSKGAKNSHFYETLNKEVIAEVKQEIEKERPTFINNVEKLEDLAF